MKHLTLSILATLILSISASAADFRLVCTDGDAVSVEIQKTEDGKFTYNIDTGEIDLVGSAIGIATKDPSPSIGFVYFEEIKGGFSWWMTKTDEDNSVLCLPEILDETVKLVCTQE